MIIYLIPIAVLILTCVILGAIYVNTKPSKTIKNTNTVFIPPINDIETVTKPAKKKTKKPKKTKKTKQKKTKTASKKKKSKVAKKKQ